MQKAIKTQAGITLYTNGSKFDTGDKKTAVVWFDERLNKWWEKHQYLRKNKNSFDAEL